MIFRRSKVPTEKRRLPDQLISIVADAAMGTRTIGDGRLIPLIILDTRSRLDLEEFIRIHRHFPPGDVVSRWATLMDGSGRVVLLLELKGPMDLQVAVEFKIEKQAGLIDQIIHMRSAYIMAGKPGDRFAEKFDEPKVLIEIPDTGFGSVWNELYSKSIIKRLRREGLSKKHAKIAAESYISEFRKLGSTRIGSRADPTVAKEEVK